MLRALSNTLGTLLVAAVALAGCNREPPHGGAGTSSPIPPAPQARAPVVAPAGSSPAAPATPSPEELAAIPQGACSNKTAPRGLPAAPAIEADPGDVLMPAIKDRLAKEARGAVDACVAQARTRAPGLAGRIVLTLVLPPEGGIKSAAVEAGNGDATLHRCVTDALHATALPSFVSGGPLELSHQEIALCPDGKTSWPTSRGWR
jgi:hypothetical protein